MQRKIWFFTLAALLVFATLALTAAAVTNTQVVILPAADTRYSAQINATVEVNGSMYACSAAGCQVVFANVSQVGINYTRTAPTSGSEAGGCISRSNLNNGTATNWSCLFNTTLLEDIGTYTFTAYIYNGTGAQLVQRNTTTSTGVLIDNMVPVVSIDQASNTLITSGSITATVTNTSTCRIRFTDGTRDYNMPRSGSTCTYTLSSSTIPDSTYSITVRANDGLNITTSDSRNIPIRLSSATIDGNVGKATIANVVQTSQAQQTKNWTILIIVLIVGYLASTGKLKNMFK